MRIVVQRLGGNRYGSIVERDDGVRFSVAGPGFMARLPHDLAHYVVESELALADGFWGSIADGAVFAGMDWIEGRRRPHATEHGRALIKANDNGLTGAEVVTAIFANALEQALTGDELVLAGELRRRWTGRPGGSVIGRETSVRICTALRELAERWEETPIGGTLTVMWDARRPLHRRQHRRRRG
jgi:hypothetical protein